MRLFNQLNKHLEKHERCLRKIDPPHPPPTAEPELTLEERVAKLEQRLDTMQLLLSDFYRYGKLQNLLVAGDFKAADEETVNVILGVAGQERDTLSPDIFQKFSCDVLRVIDKLWDVYSNGRFGFSTQLRIYQNLGGSINSLRAQDNSFLFKFGDQVGWRANDQWQDGTYDQWDFSLEAPEGCFPAIWWKSPYGQKMVNYCFTRFLTCDL